MQLCILSVLLRWHINAAKYAIEMVLLLLHVCKFVIMKNNWKMYAHRTWTMISLQKVEQFLNSNRAIHIAPNTNPEKVDLFKKKCKNLFENELRTVVIWNLCNVEGYVWVLLLQKKKQKRSSTRRRARPTNAYGVEMVIFPRPR